jgi:hypothetical protein
MCFCRFFITELRMRIAEITKETERMQAHTLTHTHTHTHTREHMQYASHTHTYSHTLTNTHTHIHAHRASPAKFRRTTNVSCS